ncbi:MAG TPA: DNA alkylation repair protein [Terriglobales bacterium]|nr:DNA alkylation repair protein [Terriglobales bacterium]
MKSPSYIADHIRRVIKDGGSAPHAAEVQWFFKEEVKSRGWYTDELRKVATRFRRALLHDCGRDYMVQVADDLFQGDVLEEKALAVYLLQKSVADFGNKDFHLFESWLDRVSSWADHDALVSYLIGPMIAQEPSRVKIVFRWAQSKDRWHRRAACVALLRGNRKQMFFDETARLTRMLLTDEDDIVLKGLGWLLRESAKYNREATVPFLLTIRDRAPRLVLRTACETLPPELKRDILFTTRGAHNQRRLSATQRR